MKKIRVKKSFILALFLSLKQIELSLDRTWEEPIGEKDMLKDYLKNKNPYKKIISIIEKFFKGQKTFLKTKELDLHNKIRKSDNQFYIFCCYYSYYLKVKFYKLFGYYYLQTDELAYVLKLFEDAFYIMNNFPEGKERRILVDVRYNMTMFNDLLRFRFSRKELEIADYIEHFNEATFITHYSFEEVIMKLGDLDWDQL